MRRPFRSILPILTCFWILVTSKQVTSLDEGKTTRTIQFSQSGTYVFAKGGLRLRKEADENGSVLALIPNWTKVSVLGEEKNSMEFEGHIHNSDWVRTKYDGKSGFVNMRFLKSVLSIAVSPTGQHQLIEVVDFPRKRGEYMLDSEFYLRLNGTMEKLPQTYRGASEPVWMDNRYALFSTHFGDGAGASTKTHRFDAERKTVEELNGTYYFEDETRQCDRIKECICGGTFYTYGKRTYYLEGAGQILIYLVPEEAHADSGKCMHGIMRESLKELKLIKAKELLYNEKYYEGLQFLDGKNAYTIQKDGRVTN